MESVQPNIPSQTEESKGEILNSNTNEGSRDIIVLLKMRELYQKSLKLMLSQKEGFTEANIEKFYQTQTIHLANQRGNQEDEEHKRDEEGYNYLCQARQLIASIAALDIKIKLLQEIQEEEIDPMSEEVEETLKQWIKEKQDQIEKSKLEGKSRLKVEDRIEELKQLLERFAQVFGQIIQPLDQDLLREQVYSGLKDFDIAFGKDVDSELMSLKQLLATTTSPKDKRLISQNITSLQNLIGPIKTLITELTNKLQNYLEIQQISLEQLPEMHTNAKQQLQNARGKEKEPAKAHLQKIETLVELQKEIFDLTQPQIPDRKIPEQPNPDPPIPEPPIPDIEEVKESSIFYEIEIQNMKYSKEMPDCFEKCAITICYYLYLITNNKNDELFKLDNINFADQISQESSKLHKFYKQEQYNNPSIIEEVNALVLKTSKGSISESSAHQILQNLSKIILIIRPFSFQDFFDLIKETSDSAKMINGNNIILMLGSTGCGKSTTIQYLCGSEMEQIKTQEGLSHIQARKITNKELERIITKPNARSVTRFVTPVGISFQTRTDSVKILLVDTPGTGDSQSTEIDVSNGIGIINAIKPSKSVHPVIILSYLVMFYNRGQGLIDQLKYYATMFNNVEDNVKSFNYLFSHMPKEIDQMQLLKRILDIKTHLNPHDKNDESLNLILNDIISKLDTNSSAQLISLLDLKHSVILNKIYGNQPIKNPIQAFKQNITRKSSDILKTQLSIHDKAIITAVSSENIALAIWKLEEFKQMTQIIKSEQFCNSAFDNCIEKIQQIINSNSERAIKHIIRCLSPGNSITQEDIYEFKKIFNTTKMFEEIRDKFLDKKITKSSKDVIQSVYSSLNQTIEKIQTLDITHSHWFECINKFKFLIENFPEFKEIEIQLIKNYKQKLITLKEDSIKTLKRIFFQNLKQDQNFNLLQLERKNSIEVLMQEDNSQVGQELYYNQYSVMYKQLIDAKKQVYQNDEIHTYLEETVVLFEKQLIDQLMYQKAQVTGIIDFKPDPTLTQLNIDVIIAFVDIVNNFITSLSNVSMSLVELICSINESVFKRLQTIFSEKYEDLQTKFKKIIKNTNESGNIFNEFEQINLIRQINGIRVVTNQQYFQLFTDIQQLVNDKTHEIQKMIEKDIRQFDFLQFKKLKGALRCIKDLNGINGSSQNFIDKTKVNIQDAIDQHMDQLQQELNTIEVTTEYPENIAGLANIYLNVQEILTIAKILDIQLDKQDTGKSKISEIYNQLQVTLNFATRFQGKCMSIRDYKLANQYVNYLSVFKFNTKLKCIFQDLKTDAIYDLYMEQSTGLFIQQNKIIDKLLETNLKIIQDSLSVKNLLDNQEESKQQVLNGLSLNKTTQDAINQVCIYIQLLNGVESKYPQLFQIINDDEDESFNNLKDKLIKKLWVIGNTDDIKKIDKSTAITRLEYFKAMGVIDKLINLDIFIPAFKAYDDFINHDPSVEIQKAIDMFQGKMYAEIKLFIEEHLDGGKKLLEHKLIADKIIEYVNKQSSDQEKKIQMIILLNMEDNLSLNEVVNLSQCTVILINIQKYLKIYVDFQDIDKQIKSVFTFLQQDFEKKFKKSEVDIIARRFYEANQWLNLVEEMIKAVKITLLPDCASNTEVIDSLEAYSNMLTICKSSLLEKIGKLVITYQTSQITEFCNLKPKAVIQNLQKIKNRNIEQFVETMIGNFTLQYEKLLTQIYILQEPKSREQRNNLTIDISDSLPYMCQEVQEIIETKTQNAISKQNQNIHQKSQRIQQIIENSDGKIQQIIDYLFDNKIEDSSHKKLIQDDINKRFILNCNQIFEFIRKYDSKNAILKFEEVNNTYMKVQKPQKQQLFDGAGDQNQSKKIKVNDLVQAKSVSSEKEVKLSSYLISESQSLFMKVKNDIYSIFEESLNKCKLYFSENLVKKSKVNFNQDSFNVGGTTVITIQNNEQKQQKKKEKGQFCQNIIKCIFEFHQQSSKLIDQIPDSDKQIDNLIQKSFTYLNSLQIQFQQAISKKQITLAVYVISNLNKTEKIRSFYMHMLQNLQLVKPENKNQVIQLDKIFNYRVVTEHLLKWIMEIQADITNDKFMNQDTKGNQKERSDFYTKIQNNLSALRQFQEASNHFDDAHAHKIIENIIIDSNNFTNSQIEQIEKQLTEKIEKINIYMTSKEQSHLKEYYINFKTITDIFTKNNNRQLYMKKKLETFDQNISSKIDNIIYSAQMEYQQKDINTKKVSLILIALKSLEIPQFIDLIDKGISQILDEFSVKTCDNSQAIGDLALNLRCSPIGTVLVEKHSTFEGFNICDANKRFQSMTVEDLLKKLRGDNLDKDDLQLYYQRFYKKYEDILTQALTPNYDSNNKKLPPSFDFIIIQINANYSDITAEKWTNKESVKLPELIAYILGLWTIINSSAYQKQSQKNNEGTPTRQYLKQPHVGQIITIFRILGLGTSPDQALFSQFRQGFDSIFGKGQSRQIRDNLVQLKTGEGKSIILAVVSIVLALHGFEVRTVCYSQILSDRDYNAFKNLFDLLGISKCIKYGTFKTICEEQINKEGSIRKIVVSHFLQNAHVAEINRTKTGKPTVLMIDEVDVFFSTDFYGKMYRPQAVIEDPSVIDLLDLVWSMRKQKINIMFKDVLKSKEYEQCVKIFKPQYAFILEEAIKNMVSCASTIDSHAYDVQEGKIGYVDIDEISFNRQQGYSTTFAYYKEFEKNNISLERLIENKVIGVNCGCFSYAEIPKMFSIILGVTGTLEYLSDSEKYIIQHIYKILLNTYIPSVFGDQNLQENNIVIEDETQFNIKIVNDCNNQFKDNLSRPVIIFFENQSSLNKFCISKQFETLKNKKCQKLTETVTAYEKEVLIQNATISGYVTLSTATFGRGTDFVSRDPKVNEAGGIHIIQTFYSKTLSEEIQIKGRTSRQGDQGSYSLILHNEQLQDFCIEQSDIKQAKNTTDKEKMLSKFRKNKQHKENNNSTLNLIDQKIQHDCSEQNLNLVKAIIEGKEQENMNLYNFFKQLNIGLVIESATKTLVLIDATNSMGNMLQKTQAAVVKMFERAKEILTDNGMNPNIFMMQIACYRNYSSGIINILQSSQWESNATILQQYMEKIITQGGQGNEALEIGLQHANQEIITNVENPVSQIFIIGDAIPNTQDEVTMKRQCNGTQWQNSNYAMPTHYEAELIKIQDAGVPVYTFYVDEKNENLKTCFGNIACNGGTCQYLNIDNVERGQKDLIDFFTKQILQRIGDLNGGNGSQLVRCYIEKMPSYR